jgi:serine-type D-Ala-D-Ala carboxypeptidase (penicillin-binding protein 5/6)
VGAVFVCSLAACALTSGGAAAAESVRPAAGGAARPVAVGGPLLAGHSVIVSYPSGAQRVPRLPAVAASAFVVADAGTGQVLAARDPHGLYRPASTLKMLTAVTFIPVLNPDAFVVASQLAASAVPNDAGLIAGRRYQVAALFTALLTISANDAAVALAQAVGSYSRGIAMMNAEAARLGARDTVAVDPNGLDAPGQHTSAYDLALIARQALAMPAFMRYDETQVAQFQLRPGHSETLFNQNRLLTQYPGGIGGKIGWTSAAGATYVGLARRHGVTLIVTLLHCPSLTEIASAEQLLTWGFAADGKVRPVGTLVQPTVAAGATRAASHKAAKPVASRTPRTSADSALPSDSARTAPVVSAVIAAVAVLLAALGFTVTRRRRPRNSGLAVLGDRREAAAGTDGGHGLAGDRPGAAGAL